MYATDEQFAWENNYRVAIVHSFYSSRNPSGENVAVEQHAAALRRAGYSVELFAQRTDERELSKLYAVEAAWTVATGRGPKPRLKDFAPDIIHVHNTFPNFGKEWIKAAPAPVVASLHNYRPLCSNGLFFRDGHTCTDCLDGHSSLPAVQHGCYRGRAQTVPVALGQKFEKDPILADAGRVIALSSQMRSFYAQAGVPEDKIEVLSNFLPADLDLGAGDGGDYWLYAGRLSGEKGILPVVEAWPKGRTLLVVGTGEQESAVRAAAPENVQILGGVDRPKLLELMQGAVGLVFSSLCYEGFPMVYAEALSSGTPILTWEPSVMAGLVREDASGIVGSNGNLEQDIRAAENAFPGIRNHCREVFEAKYTEAAWVESLRQIYDRART